MLTQNVDVDHGLTNGATGTVMDCELQESNIKAILVKFDSPKVGVAASKTAQGFVPISQHLATFPIQGYRSAEVQRLQFPLTLSWAVTIHKVQGLILDVIAVDMEASKGRYQPGQAYVALSRVRQIENLHILH